MKPGNISVQFLNDRDVSPTESTLIHSYPGSMPAYLASRLAEKYSSEGEVVFDPFCGSGSVLVEAAKLGRNVVGVDLLDIATDIAKAPFFFLYLDRIYEIWKSVHNGSLKRISLFSESTISLENLSEFHKNLSYWFHKETFIEIISVYEEIKCLDDDNEKMLFSLILSSILMSLSNRVSRGVLHWGWIADNVKPKEMDLLKTDVFEKFDRRINKLIDFMKATNGYKLLASSYSNIVMHNWLDSGGIEGLRKESVDLLLTSPPYPYSIDYTLALRLTYYLFEKPIDALRKDEIGARYKRKRKNRDSQYVESLGRSLQHSSGYVKTGGRAVFVLPHPDEYKNVVDLSIDEWLNFFIKKMTGEWKLLDVGIRDCTQRRLVHKSKIVRQELVAAFIRIR